MRTTALTTAPKRASGHDGTMANIETRTAAAPIGHQPRGHPNSVMAVAKKSGADMSHSAPADGAIGCVTRGSSAQPNAFAAPSRWSRP
jgi:hypothetical protein